MKVGVGRGEDPEVVDSPQLYSRPRGKGLIPASTSDQYDPLSGCALRSVADGAAKDASGHSLATDERLAVKETVELLSRSYSWQ